MMHPSLYDSLLGGTASSKGIGKTKIDSINHLYDVNYDEFWFSVKYRRHFLTVFAGFLMVSKPWLVHSIKDLA